MKTAVVVNSTDAYQAACLAGLGLIQAPVRGTRHLVRSGALVGVPPDHTAPAMPISLLYPHRRHVPPRVQAMLPWMEQLVRAELDAPLQAAAPPRGGKARR